ncbi:unnamed protein product [Adineta ricciae]|uniref:Uncharacterized protein n=1 Tax=Adineta ricciae TaxID=249248 RepID=A0A813N845_ADIRI|nr:unnamed protein product [Adineta ricciae]CAF0790733.1 unnamed protein product [Adineta ricciae]
MFHNQSDKNLLPTYRLFFDDIEELFLHTISLRMLHVLIISTGLFAIGIIIILLSRSTNVYLSYLNSFLYAVTFYDLLQLLSLVALKYNSTEQFYNQLCRWPYYLKSSAESGQCLTLIFLFALSRYHIRYFLTHNLLPNTNRINFRALTFVCLLFIVYDNNWITHLKLEKLHLITLNETKYEINIQEIRLSFYDTSNVELRSHDRFMADLDRYSRGDERTAIISNSHNHSNDELFDNHKDGSGNEIIIKFPYDLFNPINNRTKRTRRQQISTNEKKKHSSYRINRCTYGQKNFYLSNFLSLVHSLIYFILLSYYLIIVHTYKMSNMDTNHHEQLYEKSRSLGRRKSAESHKQSVLIIQLRSFLRLITYSHILLTLTHLFYMFSLTIILCFCQTPFKWLPVKIFFKSLFLLAYFSIPLRMCILFIYLFQHQFSAHIHSIFFYIFRTKLRFSWKLRKPTTCFRLQFVPYKNDYSRKERLRTCLVHDLPSSIDEDQLNIISNDSVIGYDENSSGYNGVTTIISSPMTFANESLSNTSVIIKL